MKNDNRQEEGKRKEKKRWREIGIAKYKKDER